MIAHRKASQNLSENLHPSRLPLYKHRRPISPLECALPGSPATVHSKELTESANFFPNRNASTSSTFVLRIMHSTVRGFRSFLDVQTFRRANACLPQAGSD